MEEAWETSSTPLLIQHLLLLKLGGTAEVVGQPLYSRTFSWQAPDPVAAAFLLSTCQVSRPNLYDSLVKSIIRGMALSSAGTWAMELD